MNDLDTFWNGLSFLADGQGIIIQGEKTWDSKELLNLPFFKNIIEFLNDKKGKTLLSDLLIFIESQAKLCDTSERQLGVVAAGVASLVIFIQKNWTGPDFVLEHDFLSESRADILKELVVDGENVVVVVELPELLYISKAILEVACNIFKELRVSKIWYLRCLFINQQILEELSEQLFKRMSLVMEEIRGVLTSSPKALAVATHLEFSRIYLFYGNVQKSKMEMKSAMEASGMEITLSGALGKRTKFQREDLAQLIVKLNIENDESLEVHPVHFTLPKDIKLEDDVRLDKVKYADGESKYPNVTPLQQAVILANLFQMQKSQPKDNLADEELEPLISCILEQPKIWAIKMTTLLLRSKLESNHKRTLERSMMQVQMLVDSLKDAEVPLKERLNGFFISYLPPKWDVQSTLANVLVSMGSIKSALEIYQSVEDWENVIFCYNTLQMRHKAQEIIEQELNKCPTPKLWCLLGDATDDVSYYEKAWKLSNKRSARAQRHWALFYYYRKNYKESIEHFQKSLEINSLQQEMWYRLGYAALMDENWEMSAQAYRRYVVLDNECFEAWNNMARCYCELKQKYRAWRALQEALKVDYSNWKVWDNYMVVSSDLKMFDEVIKSYHEILNTKEKHLDIPVLNALVLGFKNKKQEDSGKKSEKAPEEGSQLKTRILELFGRLTSQIINDPELWFLYSEVLDTDTEESLAKKHQLLLKAHRSAVNKVDWDKNLESSNKVIYVLSKLIEVGLLIKKPDVLLSCKLAATAAIGKIKKKYPDLGVCEALEKNLDSLDKVLGSI